MFFWINNSFCNTKL